MQHMLKDKKENLFTDLGLRIQSNRMIETGLIACRGDEKCIQNFDRKTEGKKKFTGTWDYMGG
jgi:hypothetical protein